MRLEIIGCIASGKTTLARALSDQIPAILLEDFKSNPFYQQFYEDPASCSFETELVFLLQHYNQIKQMLSSDNWAGIDTSLLLDAAYADANLTGDEARTFQTVHEHVIDRVGLPQLLIHIQCPAQVALERIQGRNRSEESNIQTDYLERLNHSIEATLARLPNSTRILTIDSVQWDFAHNTSHVHSVQRIISDAIDAYGQTSVHSDSGRAGGT